MSEKIQELTENIKGWAKARNIYSETDGATMQSQLYKLAEEMGETFGAVVKGKAELTKDGIGDQKVCLVNTMEIYNLQGLPKLKSLTQKDIVMLSTLSQIGYIADAILNEDANHSTFFADDDGTNQLLAVAEGLDNRLQELASLSGFTYEECVEQAYEEIKDRKGTMLNRVFVKEEDLEAGKPDYVMTDDEYAERQALLTNFAGELGVLQMYETSRHNTIQLEEQLTENRDFVNAVEMKYQIYSDLAEDEKAEFIEASKVKKFDDFFDENFKDAKVFKEIREQFISEMQKLAEIRIKLVNEEKHQHPDGTLTEEYIDVSNRFNTLQDQLKAHCEPIIPFGEVYRHYIDRKIFM